MRESETAGRERAPGRRGVGRAGQRSVGLVFVCYLVLTGAPGLQWLLQDSCAPGKAQSRLNIHSCRIEQHGGPVIILPADTAMRVLDRCRHANRRSNAQLAR